MKIEKISDNQIRFVLTKEDLDQRNISLSEFAYGTPKAKDLFSEMLNQARSLYDFHPEGGTLMIEAIPIAKNTLVILVTVINDPEELDARYSQFGPAVSRGNLNDSTPSGKKQDVVGDIVYNLRHQAGVPADSNNSSAPAAHSNAGVMQEYAKMREYAMLNRLYSFHSISDAIQAAVSAGGGYTGKSKLFEDEKDHTYYLYLQMDSLEQVSEMQSILAVLSEYGAIESTPYARCQQLEEHDHVIFDHDALQNLASVGAVTT